MTARELAKHLLSLPESMQDLPVMTTQFDRYESFDRFDPHPITELGYYGGEQYMVINGGVYSTRAQGVPDYVSRPAAEQLNLRQKVIVL